MKKGPRGRIIRRCVECRRKHQQSLRVARFAMAKCGEVRWASMVEVSCERCGKATVKRRWEVEKYAHFYCGDACRLEAQAKRVHECMNCGSAFTIRGGRQKGLYCSKTCAGEHMRTRAGLIRAAQAYDETILKWDDMRWRQDNHDAIVASWRCCHCGCMSPEDSKPTGRFCSPECYRSAVVTVACVDCGESYVKSANSGAKSRCVSCQKARSKLLNRRTLAGTRTNRERGKHRKRCRRLGLPCDSSVTGRKVFERDGYRCGLCGSETLREFARDGSGTPLGNSPTIDHIIPLAWKIEGHVWWNVQCACWRCNSEKGAHYASTPPGGGKDGQPAIPHPERPSVVF
jgi:hypothetical protein